MVNKMSSVPSIPQIRANRQDPNPSQLEQWRNHLDNCPRCQQRRVEGQTECGYGQALRIAADNANPDGERLAPNAPRTRLRRLLFREAA